MQDKAAWEKMYSCLEKFDEEHGYTNVSNKEGNLGRWATKLHQALKLQGKKQTPFEVATLTERKVALESI